MTFDKHSELNFKKYNWGYPIFGFRPYCFWAPLQTHVKEHEAFSKGLPVVPDSHKQFRKPYQKGKHLEPAEHFTIYEWLEKKSN